MSLRHSLIDETAMDIMPLIGISKNRFSILKPKERYLVLSFIMVLFVSMYFGLFLRPVWQRARELKKQGEEINNRAGLLLSQFPANDKLRLELDNLKQNIAAIKIKISDREAKLLSEQQVPKFLTELVKCSQDLAIDFQSVKQNIESDKDGFSRLSIDLRFESSYENAANYIKKIEEISPSVKLETLSLSQSKSDPHNLASVSLRLSALLAYIPNTQGELFESIAQDKDEPKLSIPRSPLRPLFGASLTKEVLKLSGITYRGKKALSSAIINEAVVKVGDNIEGYKVESIYSDSVAVNDGKKSLTLKVEK